MKTTSSVLRHAEYTKVQTQPTLQIHAKHHCWASSKSTIKPNTHETKQWKRTTVCAVTTHNVTKQTKMSQAAQQQRDDPCYFAQCWALKGKQCWDSKVLFATSLTHARTHTFIHHCSLYPKYFLSHSDQWRGSVFCPRRGWMCSTQRPVTKPG